jgi:hypothetical protein
LRFTLSPPLPPFLADGGQADGIGPDGNCAGAHCADGLGVAGTSATGVRAGGGGGGPSADGVCTAVPSADGGGVDDIGVDDVRAGGVGAVASGQKETVKEENVNSSTTLVLHRAGRLFQLPTQVSTPTVHSVL